MRIEEKLWDTGVLGVRCGEVHCHAYDKSIDFDGWDFLHARPWVSELDCIAILKDADFVRTSMYLLLKRDLRAYPPVTPTFFYKMATGEDARGVGELASQIFMHDRLHRDAQIPRRVADNYKRAWGSNLCLGYAEAVFLVTDIHAGIVGFSSARGSSVGLNGVHPEFRGRGIGSGLVELACFWLRDAGCDYALVSTQRHNAPAFKMYWKAGFRVQGMAYDYHWIKPGLKWG